MFDNKDESLDLLDLDNDADFDTLPPESSPFTTPRPKKPWLLLGVGVLVIVLSTYIIIRVVETDHGSSVEIDLDAPAVVEVETDSALPAPPLVVPPQPQKSESLTTPGVPVREVNDRKEVVFNPDKPTSAKVSAKPAADRATVRQKPAVAGNWYVQFGSYGARAQAESAQRQIQSRHGGLFQGRQFVILAAVLPNGATTYRLRIPFKTSGEANGFCRNAKSDGLECYVAK